MVTGIMAIVGVGVVGTVLAVLLKQYRPELSFGVSFGAGSVIFLLLLDELTPLVDSLKTLTAELSYPSEFLSPLLRCLGICYLTELGAELCRDAGQSAIAAKVEMGGRVLTAAVAFPMFLSVLQTALSMIAL